MSIEVTSLWEDAGETMDGDINRRQFIEARLAAATIWPFLASSTSKADFTTRKALVGEQLQAAAGYDQSVLDRLEAALDQDFEVLHKARVAQLRQEAKLHTVETHSDDGSYDDRDTAKFEARCRTCGWKSGKLSYNDAITKQHKHERIDRKQASSYAEEQEAKRKSVPFSHTFDPIGWDIADARPHPGSSTIEPGSRVKNHGYMSPPGPGGMRLVHIEDANGNHQTVDTRSIQPLRRGRAASLEKSAAIPAWQSVPATTVPTRGERSDDYEDGPSKEEADVHDNAPGLIRWFRGQPWHKTDVTPSKVESHKVSMRKGAPFADYEDFEECEEENADKRDPAAYCGEIKHRTEDKDKKKSALKTEAHRPLHAIADEIRQEWGKQKGGVNYAAKPYLDAMRSLNDTHDNYGYDSGHGVVSYFLSNASTYRGEAAKGHKAELKAHLSQRPHIEASLRQVIAAYQPDWENRAYDTLSNNDTMTNGRSHPPHKLPRRPADDEGDWALLRPDMHHLIHEHGSYPDSVYSMTPQELTRAHNRHHQSVKVSVIDADALRRRPAEASIKRTAASLDPTGMQPGDEVTVHYHTADGQSGTCPATFTGPVDDTEGEDPNAPTDEAVPAPQATATRKKAAFPPAPDETDVPTGPADVDPASTAPVTYAFDYANGTFFVSDDGTGNWVDPAGSTFTFSEAEGGGEDAEENGEEEEAPADEEESDEDAPPWMKKSFKTAAVGDIVQRRRADPDPERTDFGWKWEGPTGKVVAESPNGFGAHVKWDDDTESHHSWLELGKKSKKAAAELRCYHCGGGVEPENVDPDWGDLQLCKGCEHNARSTPPDTRSEDERLSDFRELHVPHEDPNRSGAWLDAHSKKTAVGANPFLPGGNPYSGANPYTTPVPTPPGPDAAADAAMPLLGDEDPSAAPVGPLGVPGVPGAPRPMPHPGGAPGGDQRVPTTPQPLPTERGTMAAVSVVCMACGIPGEVALSSLARIVRQGMDLVCPKCGSIEVEAVKKEAEDFSGFAAPTDPNRGTQFPLAGELHDVPSVTENARCSHCFTVFSHTAANPNDPVPPCPNCGSRATAVAGPQTKGANRLGAMIASVRTSNPGLSAETAKDLAQRALALAGG